MNWDEVFTKETRWLRTYFRRKRIPESEVYDIVQDVWLRFLKLVRSGRFKEEGPPPGPFINAVAYLVLCEHRRSLARRPPPMLVGFVSDDVTYEEITTAEDIEPKACGDE